MELAMNILLGSYFIGYHFGSGSADNSEFSSCNVKYATKQV